MNARISNSAAPASFHVMAKPSGADCNLGCRYCFYLEKADLYPTNPQRRMTDFILEEFTRQYIHSQCVPEVNFAWQGGEPTLMGLDFFQKAVELQKKYKQPGQTISNSFQTNGILLDDKWCEFFRENAFLVGLSMDGPERLHNTYRKDKGGHATFDSVYRGLKLLQSRHVEFNILCVINNRNADHGLEVYRFFRGEGVRFIQFIPAVAQCEYGVTEWTVRPEQYGLFLCQIFDEWVKQDVGEVFVQHFDAALATWYGQESAVCVHARQCGRTMIIEHNGDVYSCDHFVTPEYKLGNILETSLDQLAGLDRQRQFGIDKHEKLPQICIECDWLKACRGGCPKDRFVTTFESEQALNYLCEGYRLFYSHIDPAMRKMTALLNSGRAPAEIMEPSAVPSYGMKTGIKGRNKPCPCGSGRKYKHCCLK